MNGLVQRFQPVDAMTLHDFRELEPTLFNLHQNFLEEYGHKYTDMDLRFAQRHDKKGTIDPERFEWLLGIDVAHDTHPISQWEIGETMYRTDPFMQSAIGSKGRSLLALAEVTHDFGEAVTGKDVAFGDKTEKDEAEELDGWLQAVRKVAPAGLLGVLEEEIHPIVSEVDSLVQRYFDMSEKIGYIVSGMRAADLAFGQVNISITENERTVMESIALDVRNRQAGVPDKQEQYPLLKTTLRANVSMWELTGDKIAS